MAKTISVDFDGVIHRYSKGWQDGSIYDPPMPGALDGLRTLMGDFAVFIHTSRQRVPVARWLEDHGIPTRIERERGPSPLEFWNERGLVLVTNRKLPAVAYIDDRGIRFDSWSQVLADLPALI